MDQRCPVCKRVASEDMVKMCQEADEWIVQTIRRAHPNWVEKDGTCSKCLEYYKKLGKTENEIEK